MAKKNIKTKIIAKKAIKKDIEPKKIHKKGTNKNIKPKKIHKKTIDKNIEPKKIESSKSKFTKKNKTLDNFKLLNTSNKHPHIEEIKIPKLHTKKVISYLPQYTPLDMREKNNKVVIQAEYNSPTRYSDKELNEFRDTIHQKLESAKKELVFLQGIIRRDENTGDVGSKFMTMEDGSLSNDREQLNQMASRQITFINHLEKALTRIENKTYGICRFTGKLISKDRLKAVPHATLSLESKMILNDSKRKIQLSGNSSKPNNFNLENKEFTDENET